MLPLRFLAKPRIWRWLSVPPQIDAGQVRGFLSVLPGVADVHDLRIWPVGTAEIALACHMVMPAGHPGDAFIADAETGRLLAA